MIKHMMKKRKMIQKMKRRMKQTMKRRMKMTRTYINQYGYASHDEMIRIRARRNRRRNARARRELIKARLRGPAVVMAVCCIMAFGGYIGVRDSALNDTGLAYAAQAEEETVYKMITVHSGDTLWGIASDYVEPSKDIRKYIREICALNDVKPGKIYPGQVIIVPVPAHLA